MDSAKYAACTTGVTGCIHWMVKEWEEIGVSPYILSILQDGVRLEVNCAVEMKTNIGKKEFCQTLEECNWMRGKINQLLAKEALVWAMAMPLEVSPIHLVPKAGPKKYWMVVDIHHLNN